MILKVPEISNTRIRKMYQTNMLSTDLSSKRSPQNNLLISPIVKNNLNELKSTVHSSCSENVNQYLMNTSLHGLRYVGETTISLTERIFFLLAFFMVVILSIYYISNIYAKWIASPIIIALNSQATSISDIPFPAVTICNMNQAKHSKVKDFKPGSIEKMLLESLCVQGDKLDQEKNNLTGKWSRFKEFLLDVSQPCSEMLLKCRYARHSVPCMELFNTVLTDEGLCCIFNQVHPKFLLQRYTPTDEFDSVPTEDNLTAIDWTPERGFTTQIGTDVYPRPAAGSGIHMGLYVVLNASFTDYYCSTTNSPGFKVLLHNPTETPKIADYGIPISPGREVRLVITPRISDASSVIRSVSQKQRQCVFANEMNLSYFRTYSRRNCEMECQSALIEKECGCVLYYMPRFNTDTNICSRRDYQCYGKIQSALDLNFNSTYDCSCMPGCFEINYLSDLSTAVIQKKNYTVREEIFMKVDPKEVFDNLIALHVYYEESFFRSYTKEEFIGFTEFLSNTGGLLGLFMGFSVVSIVEILYFLTLRPYSARKRYSKRQRRSVQQIIRNVTVNEKLFRTPIKIEGGGYALSKYSLNVPHSCCDRFGKRIGKVVRKLRVIICRNGTHGQEREGFEYPYTE